MALTSVELCTGRVAVQCRLQNRLQFGVRDLIKCDLLLQLKTSYLSLNSVTAVEFIFAGITESRDYGASATKLPSGH